MLFERPFTKRFALCHRTLSVLFVLSVLSVSVTLVYCGQTVGWIKMPLSTEVGFGLGDNVFTDPAPPPPRKERSSPTFLPISIVAKRSSI